MVSVAALYIFWNWGYDQRFQIRQTQETTDNILIIDINPSELNKNPFQAEAKIHQLVNRIAGLKIEYIVVPEEHELLTKLLSAATQDRPIKLFTPPTSTDVLPSPTHKFTNFPIYLDQDGIIRSFVSSNENENFFNLFSRELNSESLNPQGKINYRGAQGTFETIYLNDFLKDKFHPKNKLYKIALLEISPLAERYYPTPLGNMTKTEIAANIIDNIIYRRWISTLGSPLDVVYLFFIILIVLFLVKNLSLGLSFSLGLLLLYVNYAIGSYVFDHFYFWFPLLAASLTAIISYVVFLQFYVHKNNQLAWQAEQEKSNSLKLEELKTNFLSLFSHDLKTPLAKVQAVTQRLESQSNITPEVQQEIEKIKSYVAELDSYIKNILSVAKIESQQLSLNLSPIDLNDLVKDVVKQLSPFLGSRKITIKQDLTPLFLLEVDAQLMREVILNLLQNAITYSIPGSEINIKTEESDSDITLKIINAPETFDFSFADMFQKSDNKKHSHSGSGIGLFLVKYFVELHKGEVFISKFENDKLIMGFKLPIH